VADVSIADRRWGYVGFIVMVLGLVVLVVANFAQQLGIPPDVPVGAIGSAVIVLGVTLYLLQRRAEQDSRRGDPPAPS
jgi:hypothetical protein